MSGRQFKIDKHNGVHNYPLYLASRFPIGDGSRFFAVKWGKVLTILHYTANSQLWNERKNKQSYVIYTRKWFCLQDPGKQARRRLQKPLHKFPLHYPKRRKTHSFMSGM